MPNMFKYNSLEEKDFAITLLSNSSSGPDEQCYIQDLLVRAAREDKASRYILDVNNEVFILYILHVNESSTSTIEEAVSAFADFARSRRTCSASTFYTAETSYLNSQQKKEISTCLATLSRPYGTFYNSLALPIADAELLKKRLESQQRQSIVSKLKSSLLTAGQSWRNSILVRVVFWTTIAGIFIFIAAISRGDYSKSFHQHYEHGVWVRYDLKGSEGPKYQLQFTHHNVSEWAAKNPHDHGEWALRIDDQAMIPAHLMDEEELRYQRWFRQRYPEKDRIRLNQDYLKESFLGDPDQIQVPTDKAFHMAHCVRALRRYWQAKETGKHVCPRDIDYRHMKHCLDSMDQWAFPDGERGSVKQIVDPGTSHLIWETKVCF
ncbi:hypothetical protein F5884DRAFT_788890 [Xylogone sp. PMI_703]|nr:hypothetical protein F5884DRAFT_788890 [Xylogone sp. PMI_703]